MSDSARELEWVRRVLGVHLDGDPADGLDHLTGLNLDQPSPRDAYARTKSKLEKLLADVEQAAWPALAGPLASARAASDDVKIKAEHGDWGEVGGSLFDLDMKYEELEDEVRTVIAATLAPVLDWIKLNAKKSAKAYAASKPLSEVADRTGGALGSRDYKEALQNLHLIQGLLHAANKSLVGYEDEARKAGAKAEKLLAVGAKAWAKASLFSGPPKPEHLISDLKELASGGFEVGSAARKAQMLILATLTGEFLYAGDLAEQEKETIAKLTDTLAADPDVTGPAAQWGTATKEEKLAALSKIVRTQAGQLGIKPAPIVSEMPQAKRRDDVAGFLDPDDGNIYFDLEETNISFQVMSDTAMHETAHAWQRQLAEDYVTGEIGPKDPNYSTAMIFAVNLVPGTYVNETENPTVYREQPIEDHAFVFGTSAAAELVSKLPNAPRG